MDEVKCGANITDLPQEILEYIFSLLSPYKDFKSVMLVCKDWHSIMLGKYIVIEVFPLEVWNLYELQNYSHPVLCGLKYTYCV